MINLICFRITGSFRVTSYLVSMYIPVLIAAWTNLKISRELEERRRLDEIQFQRAGKGPVVKTYKYDPTKQITKNANAVSAKER